MAVVIYYGFTFVAVFTIAFLLELYSPSTLYNMNDLLLGLMGVPFGIFAVWGGHYLLKRNFEKNSSDFSDAHVIDNLNEFE